MSHPTMEDWKHTEEQFRTNWQLPNCIGAIDGKHVVTDKLQTTVGRCTSIIKKTFSIVLLDLVDANYKYVVTDVLSP